MIRKKILLLGDFGVGKTSVIRRYVDKTFSDTYLSTIGVKISKKKLHLENLLYELIIWDIEGETPIKGTPESYIEGAHGAIFVCDLTRESTIESLSTHINTFLTINPDAQYVISYNKSDLISDYQQEALSIPSNVFLTSAKDDQNIETLFTNLVR